MSCPSHLGVSKNRGTFFHGWFIVVPNPMNKWDDLGGFSHLFLAENRLLCPENFGHAGTDDAQFPDCAGLGVSRAHSGGSHLFGGESLPFEVLKKGPWLVRLFVGDDKSNYPVASYIGDYFINHEIRIPINQPGFNGQ